MDLRGICVVGLSKRSYTIMHTVHTVCAGTKAKKIDSPC
jgi:hypothetical protein